MIRYQITNSETGGQFMIETEKGLPDPMPPEWGKEPKIVSTDITNDLTLAAQAKAAILAAKARFMKVSMSGKTQDEQDLYKLVAAVVSNAPITTPVVPVVKLGMQNVNPWLAGLLAGSVAGGAIVLIELLTR